MTGGLKEFQVRSSYGIVMFLNVRTDRISAGCNSVCIFWMQRHMVKPHCSNFRTITIFPVSWFFGFHGSLGESVQLFEGAFFVYDLEPFCPLAYGGKFLKFKLTRVQGFYRNHLSLVMRKRVFGSFRPGQIQTGLCSHGS